MKGDFSRMRFEPKQHYTSVLQQQGRVQLDADGNEQRAIDEHLRRTETRDVIGEDGAPINDAGFAIALDANGTGLTIGAGRYYVGGLLCENETALAYAAQPYLVGVTPDIGVLLGDLRAGRSTALEIWLEAWQRLATPIDDPCLREPALGEADTTLRLQTVWRVHVVPLAASQPRLGNIRRDDEPVLASDIFRLDCCTRMRRAMVEVSPPGRLSARTSEDPSQGSCLPSPNAAYRGLENQLYRVEIHSGGAGGGSTYKWSRENGSVLTRIAHVSGATLTLDSLGPDANLGLAPEQWVEILDDSDEFASTPNQPGTLAQIRTIDPALRTVTLYQTAPAVDTNSGHAKLRRWDQTRADATTGGLACAPGTWQELENGVEIQFAVDGTYQPGDYWLIPARTATGDIEWPPCGRVGADFQPPQRIEVRRAALACIHFDARKRSFVPQDCRQFFRPLTELGAAVTPAALHVTAISWPNDDVIPLDQLLFGGLSFTFDRAPDMPVDARNVIFVLEVLLPTAQFERPAAFAAGFGAVRSPVIVDGSTKLTGTTLAWTVPRGLWLYLDQVLNSDIDLANEGLFARARVTLKSRTIAQGSGTAARYLDGQCFTVQGSRADKSVRLDLQLPSGNQEKASDFESWFYVAPVLLITSFAIAPASVAVVRDATGATKVVDNTNNQPNPSAPAVQPTGTVALSYNALSDTVVTLSVVNAAAQNVVSVPASINIPKGSRQQSFPINVIGNPGATATKFDIAATITSVSGFHSSQTAALTVTGFTIIGRPGINLTSGLLDQPVRNIINKPTEPNG